MFQLIIGFLLNSSVVLLAPKKKLLTLDGAITAFVIGMLFYLLGGFFSWLLLILFFLSSSIIGKVKKYYGLIDETELVAQEKKGRSAIQVIANSVPALICLFFFHFTDQAYFYLAMVGTIAGATADTWASEIGILSKNKPISILTFKPVAPGLSGGITVLGTVASFLGAGFIAVSFLVFFYGKLQSIEQAFLYSVIIVLSGFVSSVIDSILGILVQEKFQLENQVITEVKGHESSTVLYSGIKGIDNNMVNLITGVLTAFVATIFAYCLL